jgi:group II intron reverse transcriptase/maturase
MNIESAKSVSTRQRRIAELAEYHQEQGLSTLSHHLDMEWMKEAYRRVRKDSAPGVDGKTVAEYGCELEKNLGALIGRAKSGSYKAPPVKRVHIAKADGKETRPIGMPTVEDKILQRAVVMLLEPIYEREFYDFSYGFRPGRSAHQALQAIWQGIMGQKTGWMLDVDIRAFFDTLDHGVLMEILQKRVKDGVVLRLVAKWLKAGVMEAGALSYPEAGTPQGGVISPILSNLYLHEVLDEWFEAAVKPRLKGRGFMVRYADDCAPRARVSREADAVQNCTTDEGKKAPRNLLAGAGSKSPSAAAAKSRGGEREKEKAREEPGQISERKLNESEPLMTCRKRGNEIKTAQSRWRGKSAGRACLWPERSPALRWQDPLARRLCGTWEPSGPMRTENTKRKPREVESREAAPRSGTARSSWEVPDKGMEPRGRAEEALNNEPTCKGRSR